MYNLSGLQGNVLYGLLFVESQEIKKIAEYVLESSKMFVTAVFVFSVMWEFFTHCNYKDLLLRTVLCLVIFTGYESFINNSLKISFTISEKIVTENNKNNPIIKGFKKSSGKSFWDKLLGIVHVPWNDVASVIIWLLVYLAFMFIKIIYSVTYSLLYIFIPIQALFFIFSPTSGTLKGVFRTYLTLLATPLVTAVILTVLGDGIDKININSEFSLDDTLQGLVQLLLSAILILYAPTFASSLFDGRGVGAVSNKVAQRIASFIGPFGVETIVRWAARVPTRLIRGSYRKGKNLFKNNIIKKLFPNKKDKAKTKSPQKKSGQKPTGKRNTKKINGANNQPKNNMPDFKNLKQINKENDRRKPAPSSQSKQSPIKNSKSMDKKAKNSVELLEMTKKDLASKRPHSKNNKENLARKRHFTRKMLSQKSLLEVTSIADIPVKPQRKRKKKVSKKISKKVLKKPRRTNAQIPRKTTR